MKLKRSAQLTLVGWGCCQVLQRTLVPLFSRPAIEYTFALRQLLTLAVLPPLAYMLGHARSGLRLAIISNCRQTRSISELIRASLN